MVVAPSRPWHTNANEDNYLESYCHCFRSGLSHVIFCHSISVPVFTKPVLLISCENMNQAVHGDVVVVKVFDEKEWKAPADKAIDQEGLHLHNTPTSTHAFPIATLKDDNIEDSDKDQHTCVRIESSPINLTQATCCRETAHRSGHGHHQVQLDSIHISLHSPTYTTTNLLATHQLHLPHQQYLPHPTLHASPSQPSLPCCSPTSRSTLSKLPFSLAKRSSS